MASPEWAVCFCFLTYFLDGASHEDPQEIEAVSGDDVLLPCQGPRDAHVTLVTWVRPDLRFDGYVFFLREDHSYEDFQHPSYHGRVELRNPEMKHRDFSVILKEVNINDTGTYECQILSRNPEHRRRLTEQRHLINLKVTDFVQRNIIAEPGQTVTLTCWAPRNIYIETVTWRRTDSEEESVFHNWDHWFVRNFQYPSFRNRVELKDAGMKNGDVSLVLKDVTVEDSGTYECSVYPRSYSVTNNFDPLCIINLDVHVQPGGGVRRTEDGGDKDGGDKDGGDKDGGDKDGGDKDGGKKDIVSTIVQVVSLSVVFAVHIVGIGLVKCRKYKGLKEHPHTPPADKAEEFELNYLNPEILEKMTE